MKNCKLRERRSIGSISHCAMRRPALGLDVDLQAAMKATALLGKHQHYLLFPFPTGKAMSDATMSRLMERKGFKARAHGFRATFRTWVEEKTNTEYEVEEAALGHTVYSETVQAYQRSDRLEKRCKLLQ